MNRKMCLFEGVNENQIGERKTEIVRGREMKKKDRREKYRNSYRELVRNKSDRQRKKWGEEENGEK